MRRAPLIALLTSAVLAVAAVALLALGRGDDVPKLNAPAYPEPLASPVTQGVDYLGAPVTVPQSGRPAVVTFLFAHCPTVCPMVGNQISVALDRLDPDERKGVDVVAISVDPTGDTPQSVGDFLAKHKLKGRMQYLVGTRAQLMPIWQEWGVEAQPGTNPTASLHTARVVLIDKKGRQIGSYPGGLPIPPDQLAADIRTLLGH